jgi:ectoine hydroxylase-related dioxygenase (phytanoyl-CoA dioxygenase family)
MAKGKKAKAFTRPSGVDGIVVTKPEHVQKPIRTKDDWRNLFPRYPVEDDGYTKAYRVDNEDEKELQQAIEAFERYGVVVIHVMQEEQCDKLFDAFWEEANLMADENKVQQIAKLDKNDPSTWETENWSTGGKFLMYRHALHEEAFKARVNPNVVKFWRAIYGGTEKLWTSIDHWGIMRGTVFPDGSNRGDWRHNLKLHWDINPYRHDAELNMGECGRFQGLLAVVDCPVEVGGFCCVPGSHKFMTTWSKENRCPEDYDINSNAGFKLLPNDPMQEFNQRFPIRKGDMVIWDSRQAHANFPNHSSQVRLVEYIRFMPAVPNSAARDKLIAPNVWDKYPQFQKKFKDHDGFTKEEKQLMGVINWDE